MRKASGVVAIIGLVLLTIGTEDVAAKQVEFNYQGRVKVHGQPFNGLGKFKFAIVDSPATVSYWSNDGTSVAGSEPSAAVDITVSDGVFNVIVGDDSLPNMTKLPPAIFNIKNKKLHLRSWFSDGTHGFEQLHPDKQITNAMLFGIVSPEGLDIYVDPATGDDDYPGTNPDHPKRTIQSAWDSLPALLEESATIHLVDGVYREEIFMTGKTVVGDATITILGNVSTPSAVRITGADEGNETLPVRDYGLRINDQNDLLITGVLIDYCHEQGIHAQESSFSLTDCELDHNGDVGTSGGSLLGEYSIIHATRVTASNSHCGLYAMRTATLFAVDCVVQDNWLRGIASNGNSYVWIEGCLIDGTTHTGVMVHNLSNASFYAVPSTVSNNGIGVDSETGSVANTGGGTWVSYSGNGDDEYHERGGQIY